MPSSELEDNWLVLIVQWNLILNYILVHKSIYDLLRVLVLVIEIRSWSLSRVFCSTVRLYDYVLIIDLLVSKFRLECTITVMVITKWWTQIRDNIKIEFICLVSHFTLSLDYSVSGSESIKGLSQVPILFFLFFHWYQILGSMENDPQSLMLITVMKNIQKLGYVFEVSHSFFILGWSILKRDILLRYLFHM